MQLASGFMVSRALYVAACLGIADALAEGPMTVAALAQKCGASADHLRRLLAALSAHGVFEFEADGRVGQNALSKTLRARGPRSVRSFVLYQGSTWNWRAWEALPESVKSDRVAFDIAHGCSLFDYIGNHPEHAETFSRAMREGTGAVIAKILSLYDFSRFRNIVDVGGGSGALLAAILSVNRHAHGILVDRPELRDEARERLREAHLESRCEFRSADFFDALPPEGDLYVLKNVLHDWNDADAASILEKCATAMDPHGRVLIIDALVDSRLHQPEVQLMDLTMMVLTGGRERDEASLSALCRQAGLIPDRTLSLAPHVALIEAKRES